ncbi:MULTISPECIES: hypothetical protein [unclassified Ensifer]|uniref:hypothetical protein n=1 Tax=unclassified Ensifer TaxID=2633371 RepID=UPI00070D2E3E|nr:MULTISPECIES: hypothetical protein [unclassified Ensifer]KQW62676.1 hypothetical protein ASD02_00650 [Ensifer sp. Root1252]KRC83496.1 hypothetical protein ASE32_00645 [Ensifer sp. Root231]KRC86598.1 hypothetical protein ASE47_17005 [Ensifer sp. Root258]
MTLAFHARNAASAARVRARILRTGFTLFGQRVWSAEEDLVCQLFYPDYFALRQILYNRTSRAIQKRCQSLGLAKRRRQWGPLDKQKLRKLYPSATREEICATFPDVAWENIQAVARYYGWKRNKKPYKITGVVSLDQVRVRCYEIKWTMRDLDEESRTKRYFQTRGHRSKYPNFKEINRAASVLGGQLEIQWRQE